MEKKNEITYKENTKYIIDDIKKFHNHISFCNRVGKSIHEKKKIFFLQGEFFIKNLRNLK